MADLLERIMARHPRVGQRCFELEAICLAEKAAGLKEGDSLLKSEDDILPALAQAVRESDVDLADMACDYGVEPIELRRKLARGRVGELLKPGEISGLSDEELASRLQQPRTSTASKQGSCWMRSFVGPPQLQAPARLCRFGIEQ